MKPKLSIIILSYNTKLLLRGEISFEVIIPDNGSSDGSIDMVKKEFPWVKKVIDIGENLGFAKGNNIARPFSRGEYILFLNSDTLVPRGTLKGVIEYLSKHKEVGAITCKLVMPDGGLDKDARRSFISPWIGFVHLFLRLDRLFPKSKLFAKYWYGYISADKTHEIDALQGAFFLTRKEILDRVGWFDEDYFLDGEDIDLSWKIKNLGYKNVYYPKVHVIHIKGAAKGKNKISEKGVTFKNKLKYRMAGVNSMEIFVRKRIWNQYSLPLMLLVLFGIKIIKGVRLIKLLLSGQ